MDELFTTPADWQPDVLPPHPRPDPARLLDQPMFSFDLPAEMTRLKEEGTWNSGKHNAITLMKSGPMSIVLIAMHEGNEIKMHKAEGPVSLLVIKGKLQFNTENDSAILLKDQLLTLPDNIEHSLIADEETVLLLTMINFTPVK